MELILMLLLPFPLGYLLASRTAAFIAYVAAHSFLFTFQTMTLLRAWVGGETHAFARDPNSLEWSYALVNLVIYAAGLSLVALGHRLAQRRRAARTTGARSFGRPGEPEGLRR
ncbi:MAG TPA: hypothetical protein VH502_07740 [Actinoplanes sp.]|jgi:hypothetical protein